MLADIVRLFLACATLLAAGCGEDDDCNAGYGQRDGFCFPTDDGPAPAVLMGHWKLDDGEGTVAADASGGGHDGSLEGEATWSEGRAGGGALTFGGAGHVRLDGFAATHGHEFTVLVWFRTSGVKGVLYGEGSTGTDALGYISVNENSDGEGDIELGLIDDDNGWAGIPFPDAAVADGEWHLVAGVQKSRSERFCWLDGVVVVQADTPIGTMSLDETSIGRLPGHFDTNYFVGDIDDVRVYGRALDATDLLALWESEE